MNKWEKAEKAREKTYRIYIKCGWCIIVAALVILVLCVFALCNSRYLYCIFWTPIGIMFAALGVVYRKVGIKNLQEK